MHRAVLILISGMGTAYAGADAQSSSRVPAETHLAEQIDQFLTRAVDSGFNGSVLIAKEGRIILHKGYGWADQRKAAPVTTTTPFWITAERAEAAEGGPEVCVDWKVPQAAAVNVVSRLSRISRPRRNVAELGS
jgi:hypothetical protein